MGYRRENHRCERELKWFIPFFLGSGATERKNKTTVARVYGDCVCHCALLLCSVTPLTRRMGQKFEVLLRRGSTRLQIPWVQQRQHHRAHESARELLSLPLRIYVQNVVFVCLFWSSARL